MLNIRRFTVLAAQTLASGMVVFVAGAWLLVASSQAAPFKVGLVLDRGGKDDKSFNASAYAGVTRAQKELGIDFIYVEAGDDNAFEFQHRKFAREKYDLIIGVGFSQTDAVKKVASQFPNTHFALVDSEVGAPNVRSLLFQEHEGSFLVGAIAALTSKTGKVGFLGGMDVDLIRRFEKGYIAGAKHANPKVEVAVKYVGVTSEAWNNPAGAKEKSIIMYNSGADVIFQAAGASGAGLFDAAEEKKKLAIGVDSNQNGLKPGRVLTSMLKRVDLAVFDVIKDSKEGKFTGGVKRFGLRDQGVDFAMDAHNKGLISEAILKKVNQYKAEIIAGKIVVPDHYLEKKKK